MSAERVKRLVEAASAFSGDPNDDEKRLAYLKATFNLDRTAPLIVALAAERDVAVAAWERVTEDPVAAAERDVGRWVYQRISKLMAAKENTPEEAELSWLADVVVHIEEYGSIHCAGEELARFPAAGDRS